MAYQSLYRKYRPQDFSEVAGQKHIVEILSKSIEKDIISHAYLFCGPRATGKTSLAKIFSMAINCTSSDEKPCGNCPNCQAALEQNHPDIVEIDAASNNGVDEIRALIERVKYAPILGRKKIYIIDEVHMLSQSSFNALLKTLEEPPEHVVFILATTEIHKVIPTIISRCQRFDFLRLSEKEIADRLETILQREAVQYESGVPLLIASLSEGGLRNALTLLEQAVIVSDEAISQKQIYQSFKMILPEEKTALFKALLKEDMSDLLDMIQDFKAKSVNSQRLLYDLLNNLKDAYIAQAIQSDEYKDPNQSQVIAFIQEHYSMESIQKMMDAMLLSIDKMRMSTGQDLYFEILMIDLFRELQGEKRISESFVKKDEKSDRIEAKQEVLSLFEEDESPEPEIAEETFAAEEPIEETAEENTREVLEEIAVTTEEKTAGIEELSLDIDLLIQLMVSADRNLRMQDEVKFSNIRTYVTDLKWAKPSKLLIGSTLVLSGNDFVVFALNYDYQVNEVMDQANLRIMEDFAQMLFQKQKVILAITQKMYQDGVELFKEKMRENILPQALDNDFFRQFRSPIEKEEIQDESITLIKDLFGDQVHFEE